MDVDGVMTDGGVYLIGEKDEMKRFDIQDGMGITLIQAAGIKTAIITGRQSIVVDRRAKELKMAEVFQGYADKTEALDFLVQKYLITADEVAYIGDDVQDIPLLMRVGLPIAVQNARQNVKDICRYVTSASGGHGAVREVVEWMLEERTE